MDAVAFLVSRVGHTIDGFADDVEQTTVDVLADGHGDGTAQRHGLGAALQTVGAVHGDGAHGVFADILLAFKNDFCPIGADHLKGVIDVGEVDSVFEGNIDDCADDLGNFSFESVFHVCLFCFFVRSGCNFEHAKLRYYLDINGFFVQKKYQQSYILLCYINLYILPGRHLMTFFNSNSVRSAAIFGKGKLLFVAKSSMVISWFSSSN